MRIKCTYYLGERAKIHKGSSFFLSPRCYHEVVDLQENGETLRGLNPDTQSSLGPKRQKDCFWLLVS